jgi:hypothetical protein
MWRVVLNGGKDEVIKESGPLCKKIQSITKWLRICSPNTFGLVRKGGAASAHQTAKPELTVAARAAYPDSGIASHCRAIVCLDLRRLQR